MLENQKNAVIPVQQFNEQQLDIRSRLQTKRVLVAYLNDQEKKNILLGRQPQLGEDLTQLRQRVANYNVARASRTKYTPTDPIVSESDPILEQIRTRPDITNTFISM